MIFTHTLWVNSGKSNQNNLSQDTIHFENVIYRVVHERSNITAPFVVHLKFKKKKTFTDLLWVNSNKLIEKQLELKTPHFLKLQYIAAPFVEYTR